MEHRGGDILIRESKGPIAQVRLTSSVFFASDISEKFSLIFEQAQRRPLGGFKRQAAQDDDVWPAKGSDADQPQIQDIQVNSVDITPQIDIDISPGPVREDKYTGEHKV